MKKEIQLISFDVDGTILNKKGELTNYTLKILGRAAERGLYLVPNTGRSLSLLSPILNQIKGISYVSSLNGAVITKLKKEAERKQLWNRDNCLDIERTPIEKEMLIKIYDLAICCGYSPVFVIDGHYYHAGGRQIFWGIKSETDRVEELEEKILTKGIKKVITDSEYSVYKVVLLVPSANAKKKVLKQLKNISDISVSYAKPLNIEINARGVNKGKALEKIARILGVPMENTMSIGDSDNDVSMMRQAGIGVAMGNASRSVKRQADQIARSNEEEGAARFIEEYMVKRKHE